MCEYCSQELIDWVFNDFINQGGKIIYEENGKKPSRWWIITDYVNNTTIDKIKKLALADEKVKKYTTSGVKKTIFVKKSKLLNLVVSNFIINLNKVDFPASFFP